MAFKKRGKNWTESEDLQLTSSWLATSIDAYSPHNPYWCRICIHYNEHISPELRNIRMEASLKSRWNIIKCSVSAFCDSIDYAKSLSIGEVEELDLIRKAQEHYIRTFKTGKKFMLLNCWEVLKDQEKWKTVLEDDRKKDRQFTTTEPDLTPPSTSSVRTTNTEQATKESAIPKVNSISISKPASPTNMEQSTSEPPTVSAPSTPFVNPSRKRKPTQTFLSKKRFFRSAIRVADKFSDLLEMYSLVASAKIMEVDATSIKDPIRKEYYTKIQAQILKKWKVQKDEKSAKNKTENANHKDKDEDVDDDDDEDDDDGDDVDEDEDDDEDDDDDDDDDDDEDEGEDNEEDYYSIF